MLKKRFLIFAACLTTLACSQSDAQKEFEDEAQSPPENITEMEADGTPVENGSTDPDDWRASPMYRDLVEIETPAFPNPVNLNSPFIRIEIDNTGFETLNGIEVFAFEFDPTNLLGPLYVADQSAIFPGLITIQLNPESIAGRSPGIYRILIYDGRRNLISYGDVRIE